MTPLASAVLRELPEEQWTAQFYHVNGHRFDKATPRGLYLAFPKFPAEGDCYCATGYLAKRAGLAIENLAAVRDVVPDFVDESYELPKGTAYQCQRINDNQGLPAVITYLEGIGR